MAGYGEKIYGLRQLRFVRGVSVVDAPAAMELSFKERIASDELKGNDKVVDAVAISEAIEWEMSDGSISLELWALLTGRAATEEGSTPNRTLTYNASAQVAFPWFKAYGKAIDSSTGDVHCKIYKAKLQELEGKFENGKFWVSEAKGIGIDDGVNGIFTFVQNETAANLPSS